jgi:TrmH family RNA methyltransferase
MTPREVITSTANHRVKQLGQLRRRRSRDDGGVTLVEGYAELSLALEAGAMPLELFYAPDLVRPEQLALADRVEDLGAAVVEVSLAVMAKISYRESPDGWVAVVPTPGSTLDQLALGADPLLLVCEAIEKPGNLGAMLRTAEAARVAALVSAAPVTDFGNPNVVRASKGTLFAVPVASAPTADVLAWLRAHGVRVVVTTPRGASTLAEVDLTGPVALVIGAESTGVTDPWVEQADATVVIPMYGQVNSLNASTAAAIALYEANRQRHPG